jgi:hypothetical protein
MLAGCGGSQPPIGAPGAISQTSAIATRAERGGSWMLPEAKRESLLYVSISSASGPVDVFDYKSRSQVGTLAGFQYPQGQCVDRDGDVWITDAGVKAVVEYAHGGTIPLKTLDTAGSPMGCSVARSGDLAVANSTSGSIEIFRKGSSTGTVYTNHRCDSAWTPGYDSSGNLYFEGKQTTRYSYKVNVCELPKGATAIRRVSFNKKISGQGSVMWDGKYITLTNTTNGQRTYVYQAAESPSGDLTAVGSTQLIDGSCSNTEADQVFIVGAKNTPANHTQGVAILGGNLQCYNDFEGWPYSSGGKNAWLLSLRFVAGESVSLASH